MVTPGLLPEASDRRPSAWPFTLALLGIALVAGGAYLVLRLRADRNRLAVELRSTTAELLEHRLRQQMKEMSSGPTLPKHRIDGTIPTEAEPSGTPAPPRAPDLRVVPPIPREVAQERITQGLHEFRSGRYLQAELAFLRAVPEAYGYIVLTCFVRGDIREAVAFLGRALASDPDWLRRVKPRDLFGDPAEYEKALRGLEERVAADPLDAEAKTLLAYFRLHDKGAEYAKALLVEARNASPAHVEAKALLDTLR